MTPIVSIANLKGGVGKSTTTVMLAEGLAYYFGLRVLVVDLDAQASTTQMLLTEKGADLSFEANHGSAHLLTRFLKHEACPLDEMINPSATVIQELQDDLERGTKRGWVSLLPSHPRMREVEIELEERWYGVQGGPRSLASALTDYFRTAIGSVIADYDVVLLDCPPHLSAIARAGLSMADYFVTPTLADVVSFWGLKQFHKYAKANIHDEIEARRFIVVTRWAETTHAKDMYLRLATDTGSSRLGPKIPQTVKIQEAMERPNRKSMLKFNTKYQANARVAVRLLADSFARFINDKEKSQWQKIR